MIYNDTSSAKEGIVQEIDFWAGSNAATFPIADKTRKVNRGLDKFVSLVLEADGTWQWDDSNNSDLPIGTTPLVSGQQDYTFDEEYLTILDIEIQDTNGEWRQLIPFDRDDMDQRQSLSAFQDVPGVPEFYDKVGESIMLYPAPNYSQAASLKARFQRKASYFTPEDTTKEPGFAKHLHVYLALFAAYEYCVAKGMKRARTIRSEMLVKEAEITSFYSFRQRDIHRSLKFAGTRPKR